MRSARIIIAAIVVAALGACAPTPQVGPTSPESGIETPTQAPSQAPSPEETGGTEPEPSTSPVEPTDSPSAEPTPADPIDPATYRPKPMGFATLPYGKAASKGGEYLDFSSYTPEQLALYDAFNSADVPPNDCKLAVLPEDPKVVQTRAQDFVDCLHASWGPWLEEHGQSFPTPKVLNCAITEHAECPAATHSGALALSKEILLSQWFVDGYSNILAPTIAHEYAHILQANLGVMEEGPSMIYWGHQDPSNEGPLGPRIETQAECIAFEMYFAGYPEEREHWDFYVHDGDPQHWTEKTHRFWLRQAATGKLGACNVMIAERSLAATDA